MATATPTEEVPLTVVETTVAPITTASVEPRPQPQPRTTILEDVVTFIPENFKVAHQDYLEERMERQEAFSEKLQKIKGTADDMPGLRIDFPLFAENVHHLKEQLTQFGIRNWSETENCFEQIEVEGKNYFVDRLTYTQTHSPDTRQSGDRYQLYFVIKDQQADRQAGIIKSTERGYSKRLFFARDEGSFESIVKQNLSVLATQPCSCGCGRRIGRLACRCCEAVYASQVCADFHMTIHANECNYLQLEEAIAASVQAGLPSTGEQIMAKRRYELLWAMLEQCLLENRNRNEVYAPSLHEAKLYAWEFCYEMDPIRDTHIHKPRPYVSLAQEAEEEAKLRAKEEAEAKATANGGTETETKEDATTKMKKKRKHKKKESKEAKKETEKIKPVTTEEAWKVLKGHVIYVRDRLDAVQWVYSRGHTPGAVTETKDGFAVVVHYNTKQPASTNPEDPPLMRLVPSLTFVVDERLYYAQRDLESICWVETEKEAKKWFLKVLTNKDEVDDNDPLLSDPKVFLWRSTEDNRLLRKQHHVLRYLDNTASSIYFCIDGTTTTRGLALQQRREERYYGKDCTIRRMHERLSIERLVPKTEEEKERQKKEDAEEYEREQKERAEAEKLEAEQKSKKKQEEGEVKKEEEEDKKVVEEEKQPPKSIDFTTQIEHKLDSFSTKHGFTSAHPYCIVNGHEGALIQDLKEALGTYRITGSSVIENRFGQKVLALQVAFQDWLEVKTPATKGGGGREATASTNSKPLFQMKIREFTWYVKKISSEFFCHVCFKLHGKSYRKRPGCSLTWCDGDCWKSTTKEEYKRRKLVELTHKALLDGYKAVATQVEKNKTEVKADEPEVPSPPLPTTPPPTPPQDKPKRTGKKKKKESKGNQPSPTHSS